MTYMIYFLGPLFGATLAVLAYQALTQEEMSMEDDEEEPKPAEEPAA
jgi:hypothetical protein